MPSVEERLRYWRTRAQRMQVALEDISTDTVQGPLDDELGLITRMQDVAKGVLGDDPSEFDQLRTKIERMTKALEQISSSRCDHFMGFDREMGWLGCSLGDKCVCVGLCTIASSALRETAALASAQSTSMEEGR